MPVTLTSISPLSGPPGSVVTCVGTGFTTGSQVACPTLTPTTFVSPTQLTAAIPTGLVGPAGGTIAIAIVVIGADGSISAPQTFTVQFPGIKLQAWTDVKAVCGEVPGFQRGGQIDDDQINIWIRSVAQAIAGVMMRRGLPLDPTLWPPADQGVFPTPAGLLEMLNRLGAAARLAAAVASLFSQGNSAVATNLQKAFDAEMATMANGDYDKLFLAATTTLEVGQQFGGNTADCDDTAFRKEQRF